MGEKEQVAATAREAGSGMATGRAFPETNVAQSDAEGGGIAIEEDVDGNGALDEGPVFVLKQKTKSNQSND